MQGQTQERQQRWSVEGPSRWDAEFGARGRLGGGLLDQPVRRARDVRYRPDDTPRDGDFALVDLVLGVESMPAARMRRDAPRDDAVQTHWTRILSQDLDANDDTFANGNGGGAWAIIGKAVVALAAAYVVVYLMIAAVVYLGRVPDTTSVLIPDAPAAAAPARSDFPVDSPVVARAS